MNGPIHDMHIYACAMRTEEEREKKELYMALAGESFLKKFCWGLEHTYL